MTSRCTRSVALRPPHAVPAGFPAPSSAHPSATRAGLGARAGAPAGTPLRRSPADGVGPRHLEWFRAAVERRELTLHFQPQFELTSRRTTGLEALLRRQRPDGGFIPPDDFLPALAGSGLMPALTRWVLREALAVNARLLDDGVLDVPTAVNVSPDVFEEQGFVDLVLGILDEQGTAPGRLELEITESSPFTDPAQAAANVHALTSLGVSVAIDDFGTGFSSRSRLGMASFSTLKLDRSLVGPLPGRTVARTVVADALRLADELGMRVVAEGIETREQLMCLRTLGCRFGQGFWYGRPMPEGHLRSWIGQRR